MTTFLENLKHQVSVLDAPENYRIKVRMNGYWSWPSVSILSDSRINEYSEYLENLQTKLIDDIDDDQQLTYLIEEANNFENDTKLNQVYRSLIMLGVQGYGQTELTDRSGIFLSESNITIPQDTHTAKNYNTILDETAQSYANLNPVVMWSGGVDSTAILAAFVKNNIQFSVALDSNTQAESPIMYEYVLANFNCFSLAAYTFNESESIMKIFDREKISNRTIVTGDCNDQIFPILQHHLAIGKKFFKYHVQNVGTDGINDFYKVPVNDNIKYMLARDYFSLNHSRIHQCDISHSESLYDSFIVPKLNQFPISIEYAYQLVSCFRFIFKYQMHLNKLNTWNSKNNLNNTFKAFYNTDDFQRWSITNFENNYETESTTYLTMKTNIKQYSYDVFKIDEVLQQHKRASGFARF